MAGINEIKIIVCDDEPAVLSMVAGATEGLFEAQGIHSIIHRSTSGRQVLDIIAKEKTDLVLLDIDMPEMDGIETAKEIRRASGDIKLIYVSGREERVFATFATRPLGFVRKSHFIQDMTEAVKTYLEQADIAGNARNIQIRNGKQLTTINGLNVKYIECYRNQQSFYMNDTAEPMTVYATMSSLEEQLTKIGFIRIQKGYLVNYRFIRKFEGSDCILTTGEILPVSRRTHKEIINEYMRYLREENTIIL